MAASYYPLDRGKSAKRVQTTVRLPVEQHADIKLITELWNGFDELLEVEPEREWSATSVMERLIEVGIDGFWQQVGGRPKTEEGREQFLRKALAELRKSKK